MRDLKKNSSIWLHDERLSPRFSWQEGYGAFGISAEGIPALRTYIANQKEHHKKVSSQDEFLQLCREAGIEVGMRYFE